MSHAHWRLGFHIAPQHAWLNDPNGLCQFRGAYHAYFQYNPLWPDRDTKHWRHFVSPDLVHWEDHGTALVTDIPEDRNGVYSGSAYVAPGAASDGGDLLCLYYTGNVIDPDDPAADQGFVHGGREANEILVTSEDGETYSDKRVLLRNDDYPTVCTRHVRDPKVWKQGDSLYMLLGARDQNDEGFILLYESSDGSSWRLRNEIFAHERFGYMWECPNIVQLGGRDFLACCPQGLPEQETRWQNRWQAGYFPLEGSVLTTHLVDERSFVEWDHGHDFYAPQTFVADDGRAILVGWMGTFDHRYSSAPDGLDWIHCLTVPRELTLGDDGLLRQWPVAELESLRGLGIELDAEDELALDAHRADLVWQDIEGREGTLVLDDAVCLSWKADALTLRFLDAAVAAGRQDRVVPLPNGVQDLRVLVDSSALEIYVNNGAELLSTRWFPRDEALRVHCAIPCAQACAYPLQDALAHAYDGVED